MTLPTTLNGLLIEVIGYLAAAANVFVLSRTP